MREVRALLPIYEGLVSVLDDPQASMDGVLQGADRSDAWRSLMGEQRVKRDSSAGRTGHAVPQPRPNGAVEDPRRL